MNKEIISELKIKSIKGLKFGNKKVQCESSGLSLYHPELGFLSFNIDPVFGINMPYVPSGGRKVLQSIINQGGLTNYDNVAWVKPYDITL